MSTFFIMIIFIIIVIILISIIYCYNYKLNQSSNNNSTAQISSTAENNSTAQISSTTETISRGEISSAAETISRGENNSTAVQATTENTILSENDKTNLINCLTKILDILKKIRFHDKHNKIFNFKRFIWFIEQNKYSKIKSNIKLYLYYFKNIEELKEYVDCAKEILNQN